ncbi:MAG: alpha/beta fold hydrolase [Pseudomonadota bacterium]
MIQCDYLELPDGRLIHYRHVGQGPVILMLHPSPQSSETLVPIMEVFAPVAHCVAIDTPGYGLSDPLPDTPTNLDPYADVVLAVADRLGLERVHVYGAATGGQIAIALARNYPDRVASLLLDSIGHFPEGEQAKMLDGYFPETAPRRDGGHLLTYWEMVRHLYRAFPWQSLATEDQLAVDTPNPALMQTLVMRYLQAGEGYSTAYRVAFAAEKHEYLERVTVPGTLMRWQGSLVGRYTDTLINMGLPETIRVIAAGVPGAERYAMQRDAFVEMSRDDAAFEPVTTADVTSTQRCYFGAGDRQIHGRWVGAPAADASIVLHDIGESSRIAAGRWAELAPHQTALCVDLPGHGASAAPADLTTLETYVDALADALARSPYEQPHCYGFGFSGAIALALAERGLVSATTLIDPIPILRGEAQDWIAWAQPDLKPTPDGGHLIRAWHAVREATRYWPWFDSSANALREMPTTTEMLDWHSCTVDLLGAMRVAPRLRHLEAHFDWGQAFARANDASEVRYTDRHPDPDRLTAFGARPW